MEKGPNMIIKQIYIETGVIDISRNDNSGLALESSINVSNNFEAEVVGGMKDTHRIMRVGTSVFKKSFSINHEMVQEMRVIHSSVAKNTV